MDKFDSEFISETDPDVLEWKAMSHDELVELAKNNARESMRITDALTNFRDKLDNSFGGADYMSRGEIEDAIQAVRSEFERGTLKNYY